MKLSVYLNDELALSAIEVGNPAEDQALSTNAYAKPIRPEASPQQAFRWTHVLAKLARKGFLGRGALGLKGVNLGFLGGFYQRFIDWRNELLSHSIFLAPELCEMGRSLQPPRICEVQALPPYYDWWGTCQEGYRIWWASAA